LLKGHALAQTYLGALLAVAALLMPVPNLLLAAVPLGGLGYDRYRPLPSGARLVLCLVGLLAAPLAMDAVVGWWSFLLVVPALPWLHQELRQLARHAPGSAGPEGGPDAAWRGRRLTRASWRITLALFLVGVASALVGSYVLLLSSLVLEGYLAGMVMLVWRVVPRQPVQVADLRLRIVAGDVRGATLVLTKQGRMPLRVALTSPYPWVRLSREEVDLDGKAVSVDLTVTPPLSGPARPVLWLESVDPWGLVSFRQSVQPLELHVIPRARYAAWLAKKYLEQAGAAGVTGYASSTRASQRGLEYLGSRPYQPGDRLRDVDWRHTFKLHELVTKERAETPGHSVVLVVNLAVCNAEEADRLGHDLITSALTLARDAVPTALVAYDQERVVDVVTPPGDPWRILARALRLSQEVALVPVRHRFLGPPDVSRLKRVLGQLERSPTESAQRLRELLNLEYLAWRDAARDHPATRALHSVARGGMLGGMVVVVSMRNHDTEALDMSLDQLARQGYQVVNLTRPPSVRRNGAHSAR